MSEEENSEIEELVNNLEQSSIIEKTEPPENYIGNIYIATCDTTSMSYVGKTMSHRWDRGKWRPHGVKRRWGDHLSEAIRNIKKNQCTYLNNAIRKYGKDDWTVTLLLECSSEKLNEKESLYPTGYNLTGGGDGSSNISLEQRKRISNTVTEHWKKEGVAEMYSRTQLGKNDLAKVEKVKNNINHIHICKISLGNYKNEYDVILLTYYDKSNKPVFLSSKSNKIQYGGRHVSIDDSLI
jgi:hypothetical protein